MGLYRDDAVVLRLHKLGEADRIVTLLTRRGGRVRAVAKGIRRTSSKFGGRLEPGNHVDAALHVSANPASSLQIVTEAVVRDSFAQAMAGDYPRYTAGTAMLEATERLTAEEREPALRLYLLLVAGLRALTGGPHPPGLVLDAYLLRALALSGYRLALAGCAGCGRSGPQPFLSVSAGGLVCEQCRPAGSVSPPPAVLELLIALQEGDWRLADASAAAARRQASGIVAGYLHWQLERGLRSLPLVERR